MRIFKSSVAQVGVEALYPGRLERIPDALWGDALAEIKRYPIRNGCGASIFNRPTQVPFPELF